MLTIYFTVLLMARALPTFLHPLDIRYFVIGSPLFLIASIVFVAL